MTQDATNIQDNSLSNVSVVSEKKTNIYEIGTLRYTTLGLANLFIWILWGDFCYTILEAVIPRLLPLSLKDVNASFTLIGFIVGSLPALMNIVFMPIVSMYSDRYRSRLGRRIPFLLWTSPLAAIFLITIGYYREIGGGAYAIIGPWFPGLSETNMLLITLCVLSVIFQFFNMYMSDMYNCLLRDVVPEKVMGRFLAMFRVVGTLAGFVFSRYMLGWGDTHRQEIFLWVGLLYMVVFLLMCWQVKEGSYPPPPPRERQHSLFKKVGIYLRECFTEPFYIYFFLVVMLMAMMACISPFYMFFWKEAINLSMEDIGKLLGWLMLTQAILYVPLGYLCDRINPMRVCFVSVFLVAIGWVFCFVFIKDWGTALCFTLAVAVPQAAFSLSSLNLRMVLLPQAKFAQFFSATTILNAVGVICGNALAGKILDLWGNYRLVYLWPAICAGLAIIPMLLLYRSWKYYGGPYNFVPPLLSDEETSAN